eukprot:364409-Chlamydomonas_euryale.AAC.10
MARPLPHDPSPSARPVYFPTARPLPHGLSPSPWRRFSDEPRPGQSVRRRRPNKVVSVAPLPLSDAATAAATGGAQPAAASPGTAPTAGDSGDAALVARRAALRRHMHRHRPMEPALFFPLAPPRGAELSSRFQP